MAKAYEVMNVSRKTTAHPANSRHIMLLKK